MFLGALVANSSHSSKRDLSAYAQSSPASLLEFCDDRAPAVQPSEPSASGKVDPGRHSQFSENSVFLCGRALLSRLLRDAGILLLLLGAVHIVFS